MIRTITAILLIVVGVVAIAGGIWGFSLQAESDVNADVLAAARTVLNYADNAMDSADDWLSELTGGKVTLVGVINDAIGGEVDLTDDMSVSYFAFCHALEILLCGIIGVETGLLLFKWGRR